MDKRLSKEYGDNFIAWAFSNKKEEDCVLVGVVALIALCLAAAILLICSPAHAQELTASYYSTESLIKEGTFKYSKGVMANGRQFSDNGFTCASWDWSLGTKVKVTNPINKTSVVLLVADRTARRFKGKRIDLSKSAFAKLADLSKGLIKVKVEEVR